MTREWSSASPRRVFRSGSGACLVVGTLAACSAGGAPPSHGSAGGTPATGGTADSGGAANTAGTGAIANSGGVTNAGGTPSTGGASGTGGTSGNGGTASGGAATSGGVTGTGGTASGGGGGAGGAALGCGAQGLIFCDDFEMATAGMPPPAPRWSVALNGMGTVAVDATTAAHSGSKSVHVNSAGGYQTFFALTGAPVFPAAGPLYLRLYIRLGAAMTSGHNTYYKAGAAGSSSSEHETRIGVMNAMLMINQPAGDRGFLSNQNYYTDGNKPGVVFPPMAWTCVEAFFDPAHSTFDIWVEGKEVPDLHRTDWQQDPLGSFHFGFEKYAGPDVDIWYDDIAVSTKPIGC